MSSHSVTGRAAGFLRRVLAAHRFPTLLAVLLAFPLTAAAGTTPSTVAFIFGPPAVSAPGQSMFSEVQVTGGAGTPTGTVDFVLVDSSSATTPACTGVALDVSGYASCSATTPLPSGNPWHVVANYSGDTTYATASTTSAAFSAEYIPTITQTGLPATTTPGAAITMTATLSNGTGSPPTGTAMFTEYDSVGNPTVLCSSAVINGAGDASCAFTAPAIGNYQIQVNYSGDANNQNTIQSFFFSVPLRVTNTNDSGTGSLRAAITSVNATCNQTPIGFAIPGTGPFTISPTSPLPAVTCNATTIDGFSQSGASPNTSTGGSDNATIMIALDGSACGTCDGLTYVGTGVVKGLAIHSFSGAGINASALLDVLGSYIGLDPGGVTPAGNGTGILGGSGALLTLGSGSPGDQVVISSNLGNGLVVGGGADFNNAIIGGARNGSPGSGGPGNGGSLGNGGSGVFFQSANYAGGSFSNSYIRYNAGRGVVVDPGTTQRVFITPLNSIYGNGSIGIDLNNDGPTANDETAPYDSDTGPNGLQNYPVITLVTQSGGNTTVTGYIKSTYSSTAFGGFNNLPMALFGNSVLGTNTEGQTPLGPIPPSAMTDMGGGYVTFTYTFAGLANNISALTVFVDTCGDGCSQGSSEFSPMVAVSTPPGAPTIGPATGGNAQATVSFTPPASNGGQPITSYTATSSPGGITATGTGSPLTVVGLANGTAYTFSVTATNLIGTSLPSAPSNAVTPATIPSAPIIGTASGGNLQASVSFTPLSPPGDGGSPITSYTATSSPGGFTATGATSPLTVNGLANGTSYTFTVTATNAVGTGPASAASNAVIPAAVPGAPIIGIATGGNAQATVNFTPPASNGSPITSYTATSSPSGITATGAGSPLTVTGLTNGTTYTFTVTATNALGTGLPSAASNAVTPATVPGAPNIGTATAGNAQATVTFTPPASNGGAPITSYTATSSPGGLTATGSGSPLTVVGLTNGTAYVFKVSATNAAGTGSLSAASNIVTPASLTVTVTPASLTFAASAVNTTSPPQTVTLLNNGPGTLSIASILITGDFAFTTSCPASLAALATCTMNVTFTPLVLGTRTGALTILSNATGSPHVVSLNGAGQAPPFPDILVLPGVTDFGGQGIGTDSPVQILTVNSTGTAVLNLGLIQTTLSDFVLKPASVAAGRACGTSLAPGTSCDVAVVFHPTVAGIRDAQLQVTNDSASSPASVRIVGNGIVTVPPRQLSVAGPLDFGSQPVGTASAGQTLAITNNTASAVSITGLSASGDFSVSNSCATIAAHATCTPLVVFQPTAVGARTGTITIQVLADAVPYVVNLSGSGTPNPLPAVRLSATTLGFGNVIYGSSANQGVTLTNIGTAPLAVNSIFTTGNSDFTVTNTCGTTLSPSAQCNLGVNFAPHALGARSGTININTNAAGSPHHISVSGTGCRYFSPAAARFFLTSC